MSYYQPIVPEYNKRSSYNEVVVGKDDKYWKPDEVDPDIDVMEVTRQVVGRM